MPRADDYTPDDWALVNPPLRTLDEEIDEGFARAKCETGDARFDEFAKHAQCDGACTVCELVGPITLSYFVCGGVLPVVRHMNVGFCPSALGFPLGCSAVVSLGTPRRVGSRRSSTPVV